MDNNNSGPVQDGEPTGDWRTHLQPESRPRIVNRIMENHRPFPGPEDELRNMAVRIEEEAYTAATDQADYLRRLAQTQTASPAYLISPCVKSSA